MSILPRRKQNNGNIDPAHAFGSEAQLMEELQRTQFTQPAPDRPSVVTRTRERLRNMTVRPHETNAPTYSAENYADESAPNLGWEAAFDPNATPPQPPVYEPPQPTAAERYEQFRAEVYSSPQNGYARPLPSMYEEITFESVPRQNTYRKPVYEELTFDGPRPIPEHARPVYQELQPGDREDEFVATPYDPDAPYDPNAPYDPEAEEYYAPEGQPEPAEPDIVRPAGEFQYTFWALAILLGIGATIFAFVYACLN